MPSVDLLVDTLSGRGYWPGMVAMRLLRFLTLIALLVAPVGMMSGHAAMAMSRATIDGHHMAATTAPDHCAGMDQPSKKSSDGSIDCTISCSALPTADPQIAAHPLAAASVPHVLLSESVHGLQPEADPPPPRFA